MAISNENANFHFFNYNTPKSKRPKVGDIIVFNKMRKEKVWAVGNMGYVSYKVKAKSKKSRSG